MTRFETEEALSAWLTAHGLQRSAWGEEGHKTVAHLLTEIQKGESRVQENPLRRLVEVVNVLVVRGERFLMEVGQDFATGEYRARRRPPSEKMRPGEDYRQAARRCLVEELNVSLDAIRLRPQSHWREQREAFSPSYPGLCTRYTLHYVEADVDGLPEGPFSTVEKAGGAGDPVCRHYWNWTADRPERQ